MGFQNNVNVDVRGAAHIAPCTYKTVVLKQNVTKQNLNILTQNMLNEYGANTKFVIKWDYILTNDITVPKHCLIEFDGGSVDGDGYTLTGDDTILIYNLDEDTILKNVVLAGTFIRKTGGETDKKDNTDGMGKIILVNDKPFSEQLTQENTIYVIKYDFTLTEDITIPANCVLEFDGGKISGNHSIDFTNLATTEIHSSWMAIETLLKSINYMSFKTLYIDEDITLTEPIKNTESIGSFTIKGNYSTQNWNSSTKLKVRCNNCGAIDIFGYCFKIEGLDFVKIGNEQIDEPFIKLTGAENHNDLDSIIESCKFRVEEGNIDSAITSYGRGLEVNDCYFAVASNSEKSIINIYQKYDSSADVEIDRKPKYAGRAFVIHNNRVHITSARLVHFHKFVDDNNNVYSYRGIRIFDNLADVGCNLCKIDAPNYDTYICNNTFIGGVDVYHNGFINAVDVVGMQIINNVFGQLDNEDAPEYKRNSIQFVFGVDELSDIENISIINNNIKSEQYVITAYSIAKIKGLLVLNNTFSSQSFANASVCAILRTYCSLEKVIIKNNINLGNNIPNSINIGDESPAITGITIDSVIITHNRGIKNFIKCSSTEVSDYTSYSDVICEIDESTYNSMSSVERQINSPIYNRGDGFVFKGSDVQRVLLGRRLTTPMVGDITQNYPLTEPDQGQYIVDNTDYKRPYFRLGPKWVDGIGQSVGLRQGATVSRPQLDNYFQDIGFQFFDTTLGKPIWHKGDNIWVDATGATV